MSIICVARESLILVGNLKKRRFAVWVCTHKNARLSADGVDVKAGRMVSIDMGDLPISRPNT